MWNTDHVPSFSSCKVVTIGQDGLKYCQMPKGSRDANRTTCLPSLSAAAAMTRMTMGWQGTWHETTKASVSHHCPPPLSNPFQIKKTALLRYNCTWQARVFLVQPRLLSPGMVFLFRTMEACSQTASACATWSTEMMKWSGQIRSSWTEHEGKNRPQ